MSDLASVDELAVLLGLTESEQDAAEELLPLLLDGSVALFESETGRTETPFAAAATGRVEILEAPWAKRLWLDYPVATVTAIALGPDVANPEETLAPADATKVVWRAGQRALTRMDGKVWSTACAPYHREPSFVKVTYDTQDDLPGDAKMAVLRLAAQLWGSRARDQDGIASEQLDNYSVTYTNATTFAEAARKDPAWAIAVNRHRRLVVV